MTDGLRRRCEIRKKRNAEYSDDVEDGPDNPEFDFDPDYVPPVSFWKEI